MLNIGNFTRENNPQARAMQMAGPKIDTWTSAIAQTSTRSLGARFPAFFVIAAGVVAGCVTSLPRRVCDRLFAINDAEAYWRGWQIIKVHSGLGRRYRDPKFNTLAECARCQGAGIEAVEIIELDLPCDSCFGAGRLVLGDIGDPSGGG